MLGNEEIIRKKLNMGDDSKVFLYRIVGILTYLNVPQHSYKLGRYLKSGDLAIISFRYVTLADHDGLQALVRFAQETEKKGIKIIVAGIKKNLKRKIMNIPGLGK
jgi:MFS superfamily sulfate permease-like transporter